MLFPQPLKRGVLIRRYKRFLADVLLDDGGETTVHTPNPGAMLGLAEPGMTVWCSDSGSTTRKLPLTWELVEADGGIVGVNTMAPNRLAAEALALHARPELAGYASIRREVKYGEASRIDFLLESPDRPPCWLEIKNCHLMRTPGLAEFPDCVAARSARHLRELEAMKARGDRAVMLFVVQRTDCETFDTAGDIDPVYARALIQAAKAGVEVLAYRCAMTVEGVTIATSIPWRQNATSAPA
jgi:sugar fermentation stimulation protein A